MSLSQLLSPSFLPALAAAVARRAGRTANGMAVAGLHGLARRLGAPAVEPGRGRLEAGAMCRWVAGRPWRLQVTGGRAWVTWAGEADDVFLDPGEVLDIPADREVLIGAERTLHWTVGPVA